MPTTIEHQLAIYMEYTAMGTLFVAGGAIQLPLAYGNPQVENYSNPSGESGWFTVGNPSEAQVKTMQEYRVPCRLLQLEEPTAMIVVEWRGVRQILKPEPPFWKLMGTFVLASATGFTQDVKLSSDDTPIYIGGGQYVLLATARPGDVVLPVLRSPLDGHSYEIGYTPAELGFGPYLPEGSTPRAVSTQ